MTQQARKPQQKGKARMPAQQQQRKLKNFFLQPLLQIRLGLYSVLLAVFFSSIIFSILYLNLIDVATIIQTLTDSGSGTRALFHEYISQTTWSIVSLILVFVASSIMISVTYTHKLVGPTVAFRHHLQKLRQGNFKDRIALRKGDAFGEIAWELNQLTELLEQHQGSIPENHKRAESTIDRRGNNRQDGGERISSESVYDQKTKHCGHHRRR